MSAKSLTYLDPATGGTSGAHFARVLERLAIAEAVRPKVVLHKDALIGLSRSPDATAVIAAHGFDPP